MGPETQRIAAPETWSEADGSERRHLKEGIGSKERLRKEVT
jgi:hypothetical protein